MVKGVQFELAILVQKSGEVFVLDEPSSGLHDKDIVLKLLKLNKKIYAYLSTNIKYEKEIFLEGAENLGNNLYRLDKKDLLDSCYLYTMDEKFTESAKLHLGDKALNAIKLFLKDEYRSFSIITEYKTNVSTSRDPVVALKAIYKHFENAYKISS